MISVSGVLVRHRVYVGVALLAIYDLLSPLSLVASAKGAQLFYFEPYLVLATLLPCLITHALKHRLQSPVPRVICNTVFHLFLLVALVASVALNVDTATRMQPSDTTERLLSFMSLAPVLGIPVLMTYMRVHWLFATAVVIVDWLFVVGYHAGLNGWYHTPLLLVATWWHLLVFPALSCFVLFVFRNRKGAHSSSSSFSGKNGNSEDGMVSEDSVLFDDELDELEDLDASPIQKIVKLMKRLHSEIDSLSAESGVDAQLVSPLKHRAGVILDQLVKHGDQFSVDINEQIKEGALDVDEQTAQWLLDELSHQRTSRAGSAMPNRPARLIGTVQSHPDSVQPNGSGAQGGQSKENAIVVDPRVADLPKEAVKYWSYNIFELEKNVGLSNILPMVTAHVFKNIAVRPGLLQMVDETKFMRWVNRISSLYMKVPFHNATHAADVLCTGNALLGCVPADKLNEFTDLELLCFYLAAIVHDVSHLGQNNNYQIQTSSDLALRYNDKSVLENYSASVGFNILKNTDCNFFEGLLTAKELKMVRRLIIELVLATDMAFHMDILSKFNARVTAGIKINEPDDRSLVLQILLKSADISNIIKAEPIYRVWMERVVEEFFQQGDLERQQNLPISMFMDRTQPQPVKSQLGMMDFVGQPLYSAVSSFLGNSADFIPKQLAKNRAIWAPPEATQPVQGGKRPRKNLRTGPDGKTLAVPRYAQPIGGKASRSGGGGGSNRLASNTNRKTDSSSNLKVPSNKNKVSPYNKTVSPTPAGSSGSPKTPLASSTTATTTSTAPAYMNPTASRVAKTTV